MAGKPLRSLDRIIEKVAEQAVDDAVDRRMEEAAAGAEGFVENPLGDPSLSSPQSKSPIIDDLLQSIPSGEGFYLKLYREIHPGQFEFKVRVDDYAQWTDLESELTNIVRFHTKRDPSKWGSGKYRLLAYKDGARGIYSKPIILNVDGGESELPPTKGSSPPPPDMKQQVSEMADLLKSVKTLIGEPQDQTEISRMMAESFKAGLTALPSQPPPSDKAKDFLGIVSLMKEMGLIGQPQREASSGMKETIILLKELGLIGQPKPKEEGASLRESITLLKELGLVGQEKKDDDPFAMLEKMKTLIDLVKPLAGVGDGEKPSLGIELVRILGPRVPDMVERITGTVNNVAEVSRMKIAKSMGVNPIPISPGPPPAPPTPIEEPPLPAAVEEPAMHPTIKEIYDAIEFRDKTFYPKLNEMINIYVGPHIVPSLLDGSLNIDTFLASLSSNLNQPFLAEPKARIYFEEFLAAFGKQPAGGSLQKGVAAKCGVCGTEYDFDDMESFEKDEKKCEEAGCSGSLSLISSPVGG